VAPWSAGPRAAAIAAELAPYAWRDMTERMLARRVLASADRYGVVRLLHSVPGAAVGGWEPLATVADDDPRVDVLARPLRGRRWRARTVERVCVDLLAALDAWQAARESFDESPARRLPDDG